MNFKKKLLIFLELMAKLFMTYYLFEISLRMIFPNGTQNRTLIVVLSMGASILVASTYKIMYFFKDKRTKELKNEKH